jgi:hypothetical protein
LKGLETVRLPGDTTCFAEIHCYEAHGIGKRDIKIKRNFPKMTMTPKTSHQFVVCLKNRGYEASLEPRKIYQVLSDSEAESHKMIRVIDESGQDYLFPARIFFSISLPQSLVKDLVLSA